MSNPPSEPASRSSTPNPATNARFTSQNATAEDLLKSQTVGLVQLSDFRKRRAEALEQKEREAQERSLGRAGTPGGSGASTPVNGASTPQPAKKKRKNVAKGKLSFGLEDDEDGGQDTSATATPRSVTPDDRPSSSGQYTTTGDAGTPRKRMGPNTSVSFMPKVMTKSALLREAQTREQLRKEFLVMQEAVKATEIAIPFVFYDGTNVPGGVCKVKKGDHVWQYLDKARKVGAQTGVGGGEKSQREWARIGVDDLMLVRGEIIIPHHYEFYYFIVNKTAGFNGPIFSYSTQPTAATPLSTATTPADTSTYDPLARPEKTDTPSATDAELEGFNEDAAITKVVDRRWYEQNKHIFPASIWEEFDPTKDYTTGIRKDTEGNAFFFS
ncbi:hypothetical protein W97_00481 [Coniosporium apollinis CBS 100218]|uniref:FAM50A/XAP5 C-terminal domain-containing protein n=1 Tax=Coniosporium apollinis (strain CBS 100218) TaxID=1168221 RepID=R7YHA0_CONA1|nr:uncharacterized protein W97_00481 [Coniosporium apollinis CBS 100218]EON61268.1 hypothetical protein W97_00481 [Coniosporium apollinis CBS 100218]